MPTLIKTASPLVPSRAALRGWLDSPSAARLGLLALGLWALQAWITYAGIWGHDLAALWFAGHFHATGQDALIYAAPPEFFGGTPPQWEPLLDTIRTKPMQQAYPYIYPPLWAGVVAPLAKALSLEAFHKLFLAFHLGLLVASVLLAETLARPGWMPRLVFRLWAVAMLAVTAPGISIVWLNQPGTLVIFLTLLAAVTLVRRPALAGAALAVAAAIKITPLIFAAIFLQLPRAEARQGRRALITFALTGAGLAALSVLWLGWPLHRAFLDQVHLASGKSAWSMMNPSPRILLLDMAGRFGLVPPLPVPGPHLQLVLELPAWVGRVAALCAVAIGLGAARLALPRRGAPARTLAILGLALGLYLFGPLSWQHYLVLPLLLLPALGFAFTARATSALLCAVLALSAFPVLMLASALQAELMPYSAMIFVLWLGVLGLCLVALARQPRGK